MLEIRFVGHIRPSGQCPNTINASRDQISTCVHFTGMQTNKNHELMPKCQCLKAPKLHVLLIAVCTNRLVMISIERSETAQKSALEIQDKFSLRQNTVQDKIQSENFFF